MMNLPHNYVVTGSAQPSGNVNLAADNLPVLDSAPPANFGGPGNLWSPEDLLVAAVADCFVLAFRAIAEASKFDWIDLKCEANGTLDKVERAIQFTEMHLKATLVVPAGADESRAQRLLEKAEQACLITNSLKLHPHLETRVVFQ